MSIKLVIDSGSDITVEEAKEMGITHIPLTVNFGGEEYKDSVNLSHKEFYEKLIETDTLPITSQINPACFAENVKPLLGKGDEIVILSLSSKLSGTYQSACIFASDYPDEVFVFDTENVTVGMRLIVQRALELIPTVNSAKELIEILEVEKKNVRLLAILDTLEYLKKGGRISPAVAFAGGVLSIKPVVAVKDGEVVILGKARGSKNGNNLLCNLILDGNGVDFNKPHCVAYSGLSDQLLNKYIEDSASLWKDNVDRLPRCTVGCVIGTHVGPGAIAVAFFEKENK